MRQFCTLLIQFIFLVLKRIKGKSKSFREPILMLKQCVTVSFRAQM